MPTMNLASAYITIMPDTSKLAEGIKKSLSGLDSDGKDAGKKLADGMSNALKGKGKDAGGDLGKEITDAMGRAVKGEGTKVGKIIGDDVSKALNSEAEKAGKSFGQKLSSAVGKAGSSVVDFSNKFRVHAGVALGGLTALGKGAADYAAEAEQSYGAVESIFGEHSAKINNLSKTAADSVGLSGREYREQASYMGAMLKNLGTPMEELGGKSADLVAMGADLAATFGGPTSDAVSALGAVLRGETDPIERYGISIKQADIKAKMAEMGLDGLTGEAEKQAKAQATLALLTEQSASAQGQFARETDTAAHKTQVAKAKLDDAKETIGTALLPVMALVTEAFAKVSAQVGKHPKLFLTLAGAVGTVAAAIVGISTVASAVTALGGMAKIAAVAGKAMTGLKAAMAVLMGPVGLIVAGIAAVVAGLVLFFTKTETGRKLWASFTEALGKGWDWVVEKFKAGIEWVKTNFGPTFEAIKEKAIGIWDGVTEKVSAVFGKIKEIVSGALNFWKTGDSTDYAAALGLNPDSPIFTALEFFRDKLVVLKDFAIEAWGLMQEKWAEFTVGFGQFYDTWVAPVFELFKAAAGLWWEGVKQSFELVQQAWEVLAQAFQIVWDGVLKPVFDFMKTVVQEAAAFIAPILQTVLVQAFNVFATAVKSVWENMIKPAWGAMRDTFGIVADILTGNFSNLGNRFSSLGDHIRGVVSGPLQVAWDLMKAGVSAAVEVAKAVINQFRGVVAGMVSAVKGKIEEMVAGFRAMPGKIRAAFAGAGSWLMDAGRSIIRGLADGVRSAAGMVENAVRAVIPDKIERFVPGLYLGGVVPAFARGGVLPDVPGVPRSERDPILGWSTERKQPIARVEPGEFIVNREATKKYGRLLAAINGGKLNGKMGDLGLPGYADGGVVGYSDVIRWLKGSTVNGNPVPRPLDGTPYVWGGGLDSNWGDCSGLQSAIASLVSGVDATGRKFATMSQGSWLGAHGFKRGRSSGKNAFETAYFNGGPYGGHTAGTLYGPNGESTNVEMGGGRGDGQLGGPAAGSRNSQFTDIWWHPLKAGASGTADKVLNTSVDGVDVKTTDGETKSVSWGSAEGIFELAKRGVRLFDTGGVWKSGMLGMNLSGKNEYVFTNNSMRDFLAATKSLSVAGKQLAHLAATGDFVGAGGRGLEEDDRLVDAILSLRKGIENLSYNGIAKLFGQRSSELIKEATGGALGGWTAKTKLLEDAEKGLAEVRKKATAENADVKKAEEKLAKVRESTERDLKVARESNKGKADEAKKNASAQEAANKKVRKAELELADARKNAAGSTGEYAEELAAAEKTVAAARKASLVKGFDNGANIMSFLNHGTLADYASTVGDLGDLLKELGPILGGFGQLVSDISDSVSSALGATAKLKKSYEEQAEANSALYAAEATLKAARMDGDAGKIAEAEKGLSEARETAATTAAATGRLEIATAIELASTAIKLVKKIIGFIDERVQSVFKGISSAWDAVGDAFGSMAKLTDTVRDLRGEVTGLALDQAMALIELAAAYRNLRITQMDGMAAQLKGAVTVAEAQAEFEAQRKADMAAARANYDDLSLAFDRFRWGMVGANEEVMDSMAAWSDKSHELYSKLLAAQVGQQILEKKAQADNLEAAYKHTLAVLSLQEVTTSLQFAAEKLAVASSKSFGMDEVGATVAERYASLMAEKAKLKADNASIGTWINPVNWFTTMPGNKRRMAQIDEQLKRLEQHPDFAGLDSDTKAEIDKAVNSAGWMGFLGAGDKVSDMIKNSVLGDAGRALDEIKFENSLIDLKAQQEKLRQSIEKQRAEIDYRKQADPLETLIKGLESEKASHETWAEYWASADEHVRKALADLAGFQADSAAELKQMAAEPNKVVQISGDTFSREQLEAAMAELGVRVERLENPRPSAAAVIASRR
ncbi:hypothetical protein HMPREF3169_09675 [Corynebacterium sp. HMSC08C04]|uniref:phage tail protein n=1 Tax=Corynebacterium sp. HMSC08C04 TaxID=1581137 RepID=UPI0008A43982|nr:hypothetical protein [Corynebacterium sp. HMSC08C04]OFT32793.1 hypothetical protein HMPREF3169_09675 [Corynebacterium sp. HMSC08C04]